MVSVTAGSGFGEPDKQKIRRGNQANTAAPDVTASSGYRPTSISYMNTATTPLCQGSTDIQRLMYFYAHIPPPNLP